MISKSTIFAAWLASSAYAFSPLQIQQYRFDSYRTTRNDATTGITKSNLPSLVNDAFSYNLYKKMKTALATATSSEAADLLNPTFVSSKQVATPTVAAVPKLAQRWRKSTKQVATLGPASSSKEMIEKLFLAGADVFRLNFSHGAQEQKKELLILIRVSCTYVRMRAGMKLF
jgi:Pyruvate kinase